ncbi:MAG TPA: zinc ribbon domain-containing protein [Solirubrobacterales bacterium]
MSRLTDLARKQAGRLRREEKPPAPDPKATPPIEPPKQESQQLVGQRDRLLEKFTVMQSDLGGAFYEMAIRDHVRLDVLTRKAAELQRVDAELTAVERLLEIERSDAAGHCPSCGSPFRHGVRFCDQCGSSLAAPPPEPAATAPTPPVPAESAATEPIPPVAPAPAPTTETTP